jgi:hypothetical protein
MTGLALLTLLGHGYSFLSKDEHEWYKTGPAIRSAFQCLVRDQRPDGTFRGSSGPMDHALATFALSESYGMTGSNTFKTPAEAATDALSKSILLGELGEDPALHAWAAMALWSAEASGIASDPRARDRILSFYDARTGEADAGEVMVRIGFAKKRSHPRSAPAIARIAARGPCPESEDYAAWYWGTHAIYQHEGGSGPAWSGWGQSVRTAVVRGQSSRGDWPGRTRGETFVRTCLAARTLQVYYGSPSVFPSR